MDNLPTTRPGETPRARADEFCVHSPRTLELRSIPSPIDHRNPTTSDAQRPSRLLPVPPPKLPCEPPADECVSTVSERTDHLYENSPSVLPCLPAAGAENEDNVSVSTDASCFTDISLETVSSPETALSLYLLLDKTAGAAAAKWVWGAPESRGLKLVLLSLLWPADGLGRPVPPVPSQPVRGKPPPTPLRLGHHHNRPHICRAERRKDHILCTYACVFECFIRVPQHRRRMSFSCLPSHPPRK